MDSERRDRLKTNGRGVDRRADDDDDGAINR